MPVEYFKFFIDLIEVSIISLSSFFSSFEPIISNPIWSLIIESFLLFETLLGKFREDTTKTLFHIKMVSQEAINKLEENSNDSINKNNSNLKQSTINTETRIRAAIIG